MPPELFFRSLAIVPSILRGSLASNSDRFGLKTRIGLALAMSLCAASVGLAGNDKTEDVIRKSEITLHAAPNGRTALPQVESQTVASPDIVASCYSWGHVAQMPETPAYGAAATSDGMAAYVAGGYYTEGTCCEHYPLSQFVRYDLATNTWAHLTPMDDANYFSSAVYSPINNKIYVFGGQSNSAVTMNTRVYDIVTGIWSAGTDMPAGRWGAASGYYNGRIYLVGGFIPLVSIQQRKRKSGSMILLPTLGTPADSRCPKRRDNRLLESLMAIYTSGAGTTALCNLCDSTIMTSCRISGHGVLIS